MCSGSALLQATQLSLDKIKKRDEEEEREQQAVQLWPGWNFSTRADNCAQGVYWLINDAVAGVH